MNLLVVLYHTHTLTPKIYLFTHPTRGEFYISDEQVKMCQVTAHLLHLRFPIHRALWNPLQVKGHSV